MPTTVRTVSVQRKHLPKNAGITAEPPLPEAVTEHHDFFRAGLVLAGKEQAPACRLDAERPEEVRRGRRAIDTLRLTAPGQRETAGCERNELSRKLVFLLLRQSRKSGSEVEVRPNSPGTSPQTIINRFRLGVREWAEQQRVDHAENGGVRPDSPAPA